jgi:gluconate 2-dehydrogenase subunit 3-like protein
MSGQVSRRVTLSWIAAASSGGFALAGCESVPETAPTVPEPQVSPWNEITPPPVQAAGYGQDPNLMKPMVPWPLTLGDHQRETLRIAADLMLPADVHSPSAGTLHIDAFLDEWVSAPYPQQQHDRVLILSGLAWLDAETTRRFGVGFAAATDEQRRVVFDAIAFRNKIAPGYGRPAQFFARLRGLMLSGFYSLPEGIADIGYMGNKPSLGPWAGPTPEAMAHLNASLTKLGLKPVSSG